jgi:ankyrin repeat protein
VVLLLATGAALNLQTKLGYTALHFASSRGHESTIKLLLSHGADADADVQCTSAGQQHLSGLSQMLELRTKIK